MQGQKMGAPRSLERPFAGVVVDVEVALRGVRGERVPLVLRVADGSRRWATR